MATKLSLSRSVTMGLVAAVLSGLGADAPTRKIEAGGLTFAVPASWKSSKPSNRMRVAQLTIEPVEADTEPAELVVTSFPGGGGGLQANLKRWQDSFKDDDGNPPKIESKTVKGKNVDVVRAETGGRYVAAVTPGSPERHNKPNFRLLGAIVQTEGTGYYLKPVGPEKTVAAARPRFDELIASIKAEEK